MPKGATFPNLISHLNIFNFHSKNEETMEVIAIQKSVLNGMKNELEALLELTENATRKYNPIFKGEQWLDNQEVCLMMNITKRTLQTYKDKGLLPYSKLNRKNYYKRSDVQALLDAGHPNNTNNNGFTDEWSRRNHRTTGDDYAVAKPYRTNTEKLPSCNERRNLFIGRRCMQAVTHQQTHFTAISWW